MIHDDDDHSPNDRDQHAIEIEAGDAERPKKGEYKPASERADDPNPDVEDQTQWRPTLYPA
jgi:hypothetical protein